MGDKITVIRGDDSTIILNLVDEDSVAVDLTGVTVIFTVKRRLEDEETIIQKTVTDHDDPLNGSTSIVLENWDTDIEPGSYVWDVELQQDTFKTSLNYGIFRVKTDVTRTLVS